MEKLTWPKDKKMQKLQDYFDELGESGLYLSYYQLAEMSGFPVDEWRTFLTHPKVNDWMTQEITLLRQTELRKLLQNVNEASKSPGTAALLKTLSDANAKDVRKDGPVFVYMYVPLNDNEKNAQNIHSTGEDIFLK